MPRTLLTRHEVEQIVDLSTTTIYRKMRNGTFPLPLKISDGPTGAVRWRAGEITAWLESRPRATGEAAA